ncbi:MAG: hypothetical protein ACD_15C00037G0019 [uncultured bacterium]|nr:MAG: hypothetical protein ACD_15C00037G0019 [uncultured bacterium]HCU71097.1 hypothetical protein [Candidatus Moranbacteria bacterium]
MLENFLKSLKIFCLSHEAKIVLVFGFILISAISFEMGYIQGKKNQNSSVVIEKPCQSSKISPEQENSVTMESSGLEEKKEPREKNIASGKIATTTENCAFVGSRNSNKFYPPGCSYAKRIKPENIVCFHSAEEALLQGRTESSGCAK